MTVRSALGAGTGRLVRLVFVETLVLSVGGTAGGVLLAATVLGLLVRGLAGSIPLVAGARLDWGVLAFTIAVSLVSACLCAMWPTVQLGAGRLGAPLHGATRSHTATPLWTTRLLGSLLQ